MRFDGFVNGTGTAGYTVLFENMPTATAPAQVVKITQTLDTDFDPATFQFNTFGWADFRVTAPAGSTSFHRQVDATATLGILVNVDADFNTLTGQLSEIGRASCRERV